MVLKGEIESLKSKLEGDSDNLKLVELKVLVVCIQQQLLNFGLACQYSLLRQLNSV